MGAILAIQKEPVIGHFHGRKKSKAVSVTGRGDL
jgi:hypothetical protein